MFSLQSGWEDFRKNLLPLDMTHEAAESAETFMRLAGYDLALQALQHSLAIARQFETTHAVGNALASLLRSCQAEAARFLQEKVLPPESAA